MIEADTEIRKYAGSGGTDALEKICVYIVGDSGADGIEILQGIPPLIIRKRGVRGVQAYIKMFLKSCLHFIGQMSCQ